MITTILLILAAYALGAIPTAHWTGLFIFGKDLRTLGSCNLGATNVQRVIGWHAAIPVGLFDVFKGFAPAFWFPMIDGHTTSWWTVVYGAGAIVGHVFSLWVRFKGGKGVATSAGVLIAAAPLAVAVGLGTWLVALLISRRVSVASIAAALSVPIAAFLAMDPDAPLMTFLVLMAAFVVWAHRSNIRRLLAGREPTIDEVHKAGGRDE
jgi:glycerol-3-phosphate acyltransferase PlsY